MRAVVSSRRAMEKDVSKLSWPGLEMLEILQTFMARDQHILHGAFPDT